MLAALITSWVLANKARYSRARYSRDLARRAPTLVVGRRTMARLERTVTPTLDMKAKRRSYLAIVDRRITVATQPERQRTSRHRVRPMTTARPSTVEPHRPPDGPPQDGRRRIAPPGTRNQVSPRPLVLIRQVLDTLPRTEAPQQDNRVSTQECRTTASANQVNPLIMGSTVSDSRRMNAQTTRWTMDAIAPGNRTRAKTGTTTTPLATNGPITTVRPSKATAVKTVTTNGRRP